MSERYLPQAMVVCTKADDPSNGGPDYWRLEYEVVEGLDMKQFRDSMAYVLYYGGTRPMKDRILSLLMSWGDCVRAVPGQRLEWKRYTPDSTGQTATVIQIDESGADLHLPRIDEHADAPGWMWEAWCHVKGWRAGCQTQSR